MIQLPIKDTFSKEHQRILKQEQENKTRSKQEQRNFKQEEDDAFHEMEFAVSDFQYFVNGLVEHLENERIINHDQSQLMVHLFCEMFTKDIDSIIQKLQLPVNKHLLINKLKQFDDIDSEQRIDVIKQKNDPWIRKLFDFFVSNSLKLVKQQIKSKNINNHILQHIEQIACEFIVLCRTRTRCLQKYDEFR